jgi:hypothetical protein
MDPVYAGSIGGLAIFGAVILCGAVYFAFECRQRRYSRQDSLISEAVD